MPRFPFTLWRATLLDLLRLAGLTVGVLVTVIALGAAVKPLSDGMLEPADLPKFVMIAMVPMLAYALPFSGGFGATLVYYRIANENEAVAAHAGGISHRTLLVPALLTAVVVSLGLVVLNEQVIPSFLRSMQKMITTDVARQLIQGAAKGAAVQFKNTGPTGGESRTMIYADTARRIEEPTGGASDQVVLSNFAYVELDSGGKPLREVSGTLATVWLYPGAAANGGVPETGEPGATSQVVIKCENVAAYERTALGTSDVQNFTWPVPNTFNEKVSFMSWRQLTEVRSHPGRLSWVESQRQRLIATLAERQTLAQMRSAVGAGRPLMFTDSKGRPVVVDAGAIVTGKDRCVLSPAPGATIAVQHTHDSMGSSRPEYINAQAGVLVAEAATPRQAATFRLELERYRVRDGAVASDAADVERGKFVLDGLTPSPNPTATLAQMEPAELLGAAQQWSKDEAMGGPIAAASKDLGLALRRLDRLIIAARNQRMAMAASCLLMILTGSVTALLLSRRLPLAVYLWTFIPALFTMVTISGGAQMVQQVGMSGLFLMWGGVGALGVYTLGVFLWVARR